MPPMEEHCRNGKRWRKYPDTAQAGYEEGREWKGCIFELLSSGLPGELRLPGSPRAVWRKRRQKEHGERLTSTKHNNYPMIFTHIQHTKWAGSGELQLHDDVCSPGGSSLDAWGVRCGRMRYQGTWTDM